MTLLPLHWPVHWTAPQGVRSTFTTRSGGHSSAPYDSLNLGDHVGDVPASVAANRLSLQQQMGIRPVFLQQVHGVQVVQLEGATPDGTQADACTTTQRGVACTIMVADCLPVLFANRAGTAVAAAHAGWRGLVAGVLEQTCEQLKALPQLATAQAAIHSGANEWIAWLGPCIGPQAFEVGPEVRQAFVAHDAAAARLFTPAGQVGKWLADLAGLARLRLVALGFDPQTQLFGNDSSATWCTVSNPSRFFSHRRDGISGRLAACIWLD
jgi:polyphenol oxidase